MSEQSELHQHRAMGEDTRMKNSVSWNEIDCLLYFFYEDITSLIPDLWEQKSETDDVVSLSNSSYLKVSQLLAQIHSKDVGIDDNKDMSRLHQIISEITIFFPDVKACDILESGKILLQSLDIYQLDQAEKFVQLELSNVDSQGACSPIDISSYAISNIDEQNQTITSFILPCKLKLNAYSENINNCNVEATIIVQNLGKDNEVVTAEFDGHSKYKLYVKEPDSNVCNGDQNTIQMYVADIFYQCFNKAVLLNITSVATTLIFTGQHGIPMDTILFSLVQALNQFMNNNVVETCLQEIHIVDLSDETCKVMEQFFTIYWPKKISPRKSDRLHSRSMSPRIGQDTSVNSLFPNRVSIHGNRRVKAIPKLKKSRNVDASGKKDDEDEKCQICFQTLQHKKTLVCKHSFCRQCLGTWLQRTNSCPLCRGPAF